MRPRASISRKLFSVKVLGAQAALGGGPSRETAAESEESAEASLAISWFGADAEA
jgi:hypothetical protein